MAKLTKNDIHQIAPFFSPDGTKIVFQGFDRTCIISIMDSNGTNIKQLTSGYEDIHPSWSPDGQKIIFSRLIDRIGGRFNYEIHYMDVYGTNIKRLTYNFFDKGLDFYWYTVALVYSYFSLPYFGLLLGLYLIRLVGQVLYFTTKDEKYFIFFISLGKNGINAFVKVGKSLP